MTDVEIQAWHLLAMLLIVFLGIFKNEITNTINAYIISFEQRTLKGSEVQMLNPDGI